MQLRLGKVYFRPVSIRNDLDIDLPIDNLQPFLVAHDTTVLLAIVFYVPKRDWGSPRSQSRPRQGDRHKGEQLFMYICSQDQEWDGAMWALSYESTAHIVVPGAIPINPNHPQLGEIPEPRPFVMLSELRGREYLFNGLVYPCAHNAINSLSPALTLLGGEHPEVVRPEGDSPVEADAGTIPASGHAGECTHEKWEYPFYVDTL